MLVRSSTFDEYVCQFGLIFWAVLVFFYSIVLRWKGVASDQRKSSKLCRKNGCMIIVEVEHKRGIPTKEVSVAAHQRYRRRRQAH